MSRAAISSKVPGLGAAEPGGRHCGQTEPPAAMLPLNEAFFTCTVLLVCVSAPFHRFTIRCGPGNVHPSVHPLTAALLVIVTSARNPLPQLLPTL